MPQAKRDIEELHRYILDHSGQNSADRGIDEIERRIATLSTTPERGNVPKELQAVGRADYRELHYKPYRIFYRVTKPVVEVTAVLDGRRDMNTLLRQRLTR